MSTVQKQTPVAYENFAGLCAILVGIGGFLYAVAFIILVIGGRAPVLGVLLSSLFLMLIGLFSTAVLVAIYNRLREADATFALLALLLGIAGALGSSVHGGYDLANAINPPASVPADLPSQIDPRGLLTFAVSGIALFIIAWLIWKGRQFPRGLAYLGWVSAILLVILYLGRLIALNPTNLVILVPALLNGFLINPAWYIWLGVALWVTRRPEETSIADVRGLA
jgi:hypothetical protein